MNVQAVGDEHEVEPGSLGQVGLLLIKAQVHTGVGQRLRMAPFAPTVADAVDHRAEFEVSLCAHESAPGGARE
ncbi:hypothetical protein ALP75_202662 [Pseudomonas syringae pv. actinidiae]|nr:hypothetical protein ALP75_202662 [Pseudomonas syringae pv. actinidiae]